MRRLLLPLVFAASLAFAAPAAAVEPTRETVQLTSRITSTCPNGDLIVGLFELTQERTTFYDSEGQPVRQLWVVTIEGKTTNLSTGKSVPNFGLRVFHRDLVSGEVFTTGSNVVIQLPGGGVAIPSAGRLVFDAQGRLIDHNGPDTERELAERCAALSGSA